MPADVDVRVHVVPFHSTGVVRRIADAVTTAVQPGDVVHVAGDIHFVALALRRRRVVLTVLDCGSATLSPIRHSLFRALWLRWPVRHAGRVVAISEFTADQLAQIAGIPRSRIDVVPVPVDEAFTPQVPPANPRPVLLAFAQTPNKNVDRLIEAVAGLDVHLNLVGRLPHATRALLVATGASYTNGLDLSDAVLADWYAAADAVVFASTYEGFGMPIVEAQAMGRPVITSDRPPMNDVAGGAACLVDPDSVASIRKGIEKVLGDAEYRRELVAAGLRNRERFSPAAAAAQYAQIYRDVAARGA